MIKINSVIEQVIAQNREIGFGFHHGLFNLTQLTKFIQPMVSAKAKRSVSEKAILMALSRMRRRKAALDLKTMAEFTVDRISLNTGLYIATFFKNRENQAAVVNLYRRIHKIDGYMTVSEGVNEITVIVENRAAELVRDLFIEKPLVERTGIVSVGIRFHKRYLNVPGYIYKIFQVLTLQNINLWEFSSTATELIIYIDQKDSQVAIDTLIHAFRQKRRPERFNQ